MNTETAAELSTYDAWRNAVGVGGTMFFGLIFLGVLAYVFWPSRKKQFEKDAMIPLREDDDDVAGDV